MSTATVSRMRSTGWNGRCRPQEGDRMAKSVLYMSITHVRYRVAS
jgi:hypothetical protein